MPKYRSAIIGCGSRAYGHANAYQQVSRGELIACANRSDVARREKFAETFQITGYADAEEMIRTESPDLVHLITMPGSMARAHANGIRTWCASVSR